MHEQDDDASDSALNLIPAITYSDDQEVLTTLNADGSYTHEVRPVNKDWPSVISD